MENSQTPHECVKLSNVNNGHFYVVCFQCDKKEIAAPIM